MTGASRRFAPGALRALLRDRDPAWVVFAAGSRRIVATEGCLVRYGLDDLSDRVPPWLDGLLPRDERDLRLPFVELGDGNAIEVHGFREADEDVLLVLDATEPWRARQVRQQAANDAARLPGSPRLLFELLRDLGVLVLVREGERFRVVGRRPPWASTDVLAAPVSIEDLGPFLESFVAEAEQRAASANPLRSGPFVDELFLPDRTFEALWVTTDAEPLLILEPADARHTERTRLIQEAREGSLRQERLLSEVQKKEILLHCIVHDLKGPLTVLGSTLSLLASPRIEHEERQRLLAIGRRQAKRQERMILDVLEVFAGDLPPAVEPGRDAPATPWRALMDEVRTEFTLAFVQRGAGLVVGSAGDAEILVAGETSRLFRVFANLLENALRHTPRGGEARVLTEVGADAITVTVENDGNPVPEAARDDLFERFARDPKSGGAAGVGLFYCRITLERHGGRIRLDPSFTAGARFVLTLPPRFPMKFLLLDDDTDLLGLITMGLNIEGHEVVGTETGDEAAACLDGGETFDAFLVDGTLADESGPEVLARLAERFSLPPVVFLTAEPDACLRAWPAARGALAKPFDVMSLARDVLRILDGTTP